ncbi:hypothetical protein HD554DRAFT_2039693 [Boletus coccyginus]|nr:hypothetical protein HD554DRAFT_2039693 [Boletus coccyginus]
MWCARWQKLLSKVHSLFQCMKEHNMDPILEQEEEYMKVVAQAAKVALTQAAKAASSDEEDEDEDEIIEVIALKPFKVQAGSKMVIHNPPKPSKVQAGLKMVTHNPLWKGVNQAAGLHLQLVHLAQDEVQKIKGKGRKAEEGYGAGPRFQGKGEGEGTSKTR